MTLIGYWPLNEESGDTAYDYSGNENHGSVEGEVNVGAEGILGTDVYDFYREDEGGDEGQERPSYVEIPDSYEIRFRDEITISAWIFTGHWVQFVQKGPHPHHHIRYRTAEENRDIRFQLNFEESEGVTLDFGGQIPHDVWKHVVCVYDGSKMIGYVDGVKKGEKEVNEDLVQSTKPFLFGAREDKDFFYQRKLGEVRMYNRALNPSEVQYLYNVSKRGRFTSRKKQP